jgi:hypothetical protein
VEIQPYFDSFLGVGFLYDSDPSVQYQYRQDDDRFDVSRRFVVSFLQIRQHETDRGRTEQDQDELVFELFEDQLP